MSPNTNKVDVGLNYGELTPLIRWCERNCSGEWAYSIREPSGQSKGEYEFYFENDKDRVAFIIWKT